MNNGVAMKSASFQSSAKFLLGLVCVLGLSLTLATPDALAAKKKKKKPVRVASVTKIAKPTVDLPSRNPTVVREHVRGQLQLVVSIPDQRIDVYDGTLRIASSRVSTGKRGHATPQGVFSIIQKNRRHYSNLYNNAPMPYMQRLTWSGIALHAGYVPSYPASHGCIRMPTGFAKKLFGLTDRNAHIIVNRSRQKPVVLAHDKLFQPRPRPRKDVAARIAGLTIDGLAASELSGKDALVLKELKADHFARELRTVYHPNVDSHPRATVRLTQNLLKFLGYDMAYVDGDLGRKTRRLIAKFQKSQGMRVTRRPSDKLTSRLYHAVGMKMVEMDHEEADAMLVPPAIDKPVRVLITRAKAHNEVKRAQQLLEQLGYYVGGIDGAMGRYTRAAIKEFRTTADLPGPATVDEQLLTALAKAAGTTKRDEPNGRLLVRQGYRDIMSVPISIKDENRPLGTHVFTAMDFGEDRTAKVSWTALTVAESGPRQKRSRKAKKRRKKNKQLILASASQSPIPLAKSDAATVLDRIEIPADVRSQIEQALMPGSSVIVTDHGNSHETGEGTDFIVLTK